MYPNLQESDLSLKKLSSQQSEVFRRYYGCFGCEPQDTSAIQDALGIRTHNQVAVQLERAESKLGCDKDERLKLIKEYKKAYYKKYRPKCPFCNASKARFRGLNGSDIKWQCGKCHRSFATPSSRIHDSRVEVSFLMSEDGVTSALKVAVNGIKKRASGRLQMVVNGKDLDLVLGQATPAEAGTENSIQTVAV